jgi:membrane-associated protease RseP (regulator of RpoE activity)
LIARPRRRTRPSVNFICLIATLYSTLVAGAFLVDEEWSWATLLEVLISPSRWVPGVSYSLTLLLILGAHEMGHYVACRIYRVDATLPFFLPGLNPFGTFGAVIRIRAPIPDRRALFDIGVAGPIAGFVAAIPVLFYGLAHSTLMTEPPREGGMGLASCLLLEILYPVFFDVPPGGSIQLHPTMAAAWLGLFATALNLLPVGQLDGGHMVYALSRRLHGWVSRLGVVSLIVLGLLFQGHHLVLFGLIFAIVGPGHPRTLDERHGLGAGRLLIALSALLIFVLCFIPTTPVILYEPAP